MLGGNVIKPSEKVRDIGVILDQTLSFDDHISTICQSAHFHIRNIGKIRNLLSFDACATLIHALIGIYRYRLLQLAALQHCRCKG